MSSVHPLHKSYDLHHHTPEKPRHVKLQRYAEARVTIHEGQIPLFDVVFDKKGLRLEEISPGLEHQQLPTLLRIAGMIEDCCAYRKNSVYFVTFHCQHKHDATVHFEVVTARSLRSAPTIRIQCNAYGSSTVELDPASVVEVMGEIGFRNEDVHRRFYEALKNDRMAHLIPAPAPAREEIEIISEEDVEILEPDFVDESPAPDTSPSGDPRETNEIVLREEDVSVKNNGITGLGIRSFIKRGAFFARDVAVDVASRTIYNMMNGR